MSQPNEITRADDIRMRMSKLFKDSDKLRGEFADYSQQVVALSTEYHNARLVELLQGRQPIEAGTLVATFYVNQTPKSLDMAIEKLVESKVIIKHVFFDVANHAFHLIA